MNPDGETTDFLALTNKIHLKVELNHDRFRKKMLINVSGKGHFIFGTFLNFMHWLLLKFMPIEEI